MICNCGLAMTRKYRSDGFRLFHCLECRCGFRTEIARPHAEFLENERAMRGLDARDCEGINDQTGAAPSDHDYFNYGRGR
jgi:hypothetical protein